MLAFAFAERTRLSVEDAVDLVSSRCAIKYTDIARVYGYRTGTTRLLA